jgi:WD40 repeat protein
LVSGASDGIVKVWDVASKQVLLQCKGHLQSVTSMVMTHDSKTLVTGSMDGLVKVWALDRLRVPITPSDHKIVKALAFSADGQALTSLDQAGFVRVCDAATGKAKNTLDLKIKTDLFQFRSAAISPDGRTVAASRRLDNSVNLYDTRTGLERRAQIEDKTIVYGVAFSPSGTTLAVATGQGKSGAVKFCDVATGKVMQTLVDPGNHVTCVAFSPDGKTLASGNANLPVKVWDVVAGRERFTLKGLRHNIACLAFTPDGLRLAAAARDTITIWDLATGHEVLTIDSYGHEPATMAFSPDGTRLVTGAAEGELGKGGGARLWDARTGSELLTLGGASDAISCVAFSPDGKRLATATGDASFLSLAPQPARVLIWDATPMDRETPQTDSKR